MSCITPDHDLAVLIDEGLLNALVGKFHSQRPQYFRRISKGMDGVTAFDTSIAPFTIGETGHAIQYEFRVLAPPDAKFIDLHPARDERTGVASTPGQLLFKCGLLLRLWDPKVDRRWQIEFPVTVTCVPVADGQNELLDARAAVVNGLAPPPFQLALDYIVLRLIRSALKHLVVPGNILLNPPARAIIRIEGLQVSNNLFEIDAGLVF